MTMKIGFIAMSGYRTQNEPLAKLGLTFPSLIERGKIIASLPSLSLLILAALTPKKFDVEYREIADLNQADVLPTDYDLVAISSYTAQIYEAYTLADRYQNMNIPVVMGGLHVTALPEEGKQHCTSVVVGEGEPLWPQLLADFEQGALQPYYVQSPWGAYDLSQSPIPRYDLLDPGKYNRVPVQTSRGCPWRCEFCASSILISPSYKIKPVPNVIREIHAIKDSWSRPFIELAEDNTFVHRKHYKELLRALVKENLRWFTETDLSVAEDDELLGLMRDSGCRQILIGLESPHKMSLNRLELNANWKMKQFDNYRAAIAKIQSYGITVNGCFILGLDDDTPEIFEDVYNYAREAGLYEVQITFQTPFPGTPLYQRLRQEGRLIRERAWELCTLFDINFVPAKMTVQELQDGFLWLTEHLYSERIVSERRSKYKEMLKSSPNFSRAKAEPWQAH
jgi:radical SAM superfamily enzyme YgiQ (UPF0313 family)